jgi:hypothetical protein
MGNVRGLETRFLEKTGLLADTMHFRGAESAQRKTGTRGAIQTTEQEPDNEQNREP